MKYPKNDRQAYNEIVKGCQSFKQAEPVIVQKQKSFKVPLLIILLILFFIIILL